jgi:CheY-like chemotaxis protein
MASDDAVEALAAGIARAFDHLLSSIVGHADKLSADLSPADPRAGEVASIRAAADQASVLTQQLLVFCRMQALRPTVVDLNAVVEHARNSLARILGPRVALEVRPAAGLRRVYADAGQLGKILRHLALNARDAMPEGGAVTIALANVALDAYSARRRDLEPGDYVELSVADTGVGIDASVQAHLFEPFFTTRQRARVKGVGLAMVRGFIRQSGGSVVVESEVGRGARFVVYLPATEGVAGEMGAAGAANDDRGSETVMVTGDDRAVRMLIGDVLRRRGYQVMVAENHAQGMRQADAHGGPIDLLIASGGDAGMLADALIERRPAMRVVCVLGPGEERPEMAGGAAIDLLAKPFSPDALARKVRAALERGR